MLLFHRRPVGVLDKDHECRSDHENAQRGWEGQRHELERPNKRDQIAEEKRSLRLESEDKCTAQDAAHRACGHQQAPVPSAFKGSLEDDGTEHEIGGDPDVRDDVAAKSRDDPSMLAHDLDALGRLLQMLRRSPRSAERDKRIPARKMKLATKLTASTAKTTDDVGGHHHELAWQTVGPHAPNDKEDHSGSPLAAEDNAEIGRVLEVEDRERQRHRNDRIADSRQRTAQEQQAKRPLAQRFEARAQPRHVTILANPVTPRRIYGALSG